MGDIVSNLFGTTGKIIGWVFAGIFACIVVSFVGYAAIGSHQTGMNEKLDAVMAQAVTDTTEYAPVIVEDFGDTTKALGEMGGAMIEIGKGVMEGAVPEGQKTILGGRLTIDFDKWFAGGSDGGGDTPGGTPAPNPTQQPGGSDNPTPAPTPTPPPPPICTVASSTFSEGAKTAYEAGDWETAVAMFQEAEANDCLAVALAPVFSEFQGQLQVLAQAVKDQKWVQVGIAAKKLQELNPAVKYAYAISAVSEFAMWKDKLANGEVQLASMANYLDGATIVVTEVALENKLLQPLQGLDVPIIGGLVDDQIEDPNDKITISIRWGDQVVTFKQTRSVMEEIGQAVYQSGKIAKVTDIDGNELEVSTGRGVFTTLGAITTMSGSWNPGIDHFDLNLEVPTPEEPAPVSTPAPATPAPATPEPTQEPAAPTATPTPDAESQNALPEGTKKVTYPGYAASQKWLVAWSCTDKATIERLNPGLWAQYSAAPNTAREVIVPQDACQ